jgi:hypothetical protein
MSSTREQFREFLLRVSDNKLLPDDWGNFVVHHFADDQVEQLRHALVKESLDVSDWLIGWIPKKLQETALALAESLRETELDSIRYWTEWSEVSEDDGTIHIKVTWIESTSHSTGICDIPREHPEYDFWKWLISDEVHCKGRKEKAEIEALKAKYARMHSS